MNGKQETVTIHWFRNDLRLHDNPSLVEGLKNCSTFYPIFIYHGKVGGLDTALYHRKKFLHECLEDLDTSFRQLGGRLYFFKEPPVIIFRKLFKDWKVTHLTFIANTEPVGKEDEQAVKLLCEEYNVKWIEMISHTLWDPKLVIEANGGRPPHTFKLFHQVASLLGPPSLPCGEPDFTNVNLPVPNNFDNLYALPSTEELGILPDNPDQLKPHHKWLGGETEARRLLEERLQLEAKAYKQNVFNRNQTKPDLLGPPRSMSPHLRFGCLSVRKFYWELQGCFQKVKNKEAPPHLTQQLLWREYFYCMCYNNENYTQMKDNPICLQIDWNHDEEKVNKWKNGKTGFPWIDACMNQLRQEGWIHHVCRNAVACFLTRGDLWISWEAGLKVFYNYLLDGDWSVCAGNWMWMSSSAFEGCLQCPHCFSPVMYGMSMDPTGEYVRRYIPQLQKMPLKYLFEPWKAPISEQIEAGCVIGVDYPKPMINHKEEAAKCKALMEEVKCIVKDPGIYHCAPSNKQEVEDFFWLPKHTL